ncbi:MAG: VPLPA-CTERM sorting domain-containing protein [Paracoccaceae bacterium]
MTSNNNRKANKNSIWGGVAGDEALTVTGFWNFSSRDKRNSKFDPLGYFVGNDYFALSQEKKGRSIQDGEFSFTAAANTAFGWVLNSTDGKKGRATAKIVAYVAPAAVPLPAGGLLLVGTLGGLAALRRRKGTSA